MPRVDVPEFRRCCFCLPLRYGLLVWGYLKMILLLLLVSLIFSEILRQPIVNEWILSITIHWIVIYVIVFLCIDIVFIMIFSVAGHLKHPLLYRVYYYYCIGLWVAYLLLFISSIAWNRYKYNYSPLGLTVATEVIAASLPILFVQGYVTLLVRTEARKLTNNSNFELVNNKAQATSIDMPGTNNIAAIPI